MVGTSGGTGGKDAFGFTGPYSGGELGPFFMVESEDQVDIFGLLDVL